ISPWLSALPRCMQEREPSNRFEEDNDKHIRDNKDNGSEGPSKGKCKSMEDDGQNYEDLGKRMKKMEIVV
ncbi:hypothetical protein KI387_017201, partial [Taxus chinensis]